MKKEELKKNTCCFVGHRQVCKAAELRQKINEVVERLILKENVNTFLFGSKSHFDDLCYEVVTDLKKNYNYIERIYVRAEFPYIDENYKSYLLKKYENTYYPQKIINSGKAVYVERNYEMIDKSDFCVIYYYEEYSPLKRKRNIFEYQPKSGTKIAYEYAERNNKSIILIS